MKNKKLMIIGLLLFISSFSTLLCSCGGDTVRYIPGGFNNNDIAIEIPKDRVMDGYEWNDGDLVIHFKNKED